MMRPLGINFPAIMPKCGLNAKKPGLVMLSNLADF